MAELTLTLRQEAEVVTDLARGRTPAQVASRRHLPAPLVTAIADRNGKDRAAWSKASRDLNRQLRTDEPEQLEPDDVDQVDQVDAGHYDTIDVGPVLRSYGRCSFPGCGHEYSFPSTMSLVDVQAAMDEHSAQHPRPLRDATRAAARTHEEPDVSNEDIEQVVAEVVAEGLDPDSHPTEPASELEVEADAPTAPAPADDDGVDVEIVDDDTDANSIPAGVTLEPRVCDSVTCAECGTQIQQLEDTPDAALRFWDLVLEHAATHQQPAPAGDPVTDLLQAAAATGDPTIRSAAEAIQRALRDLSVAVEAYQQQVMVRVSMLAELEMLDQQQAELDRRRAEVQAKLSAIDANPVRPEPVTVLPDAGQRKSADRHRAAAIAGVWMDLPTEVRARIKPWAVENGVYHSVTGRQPKATVEAYLAAHPEDDPR